MVTITEVEFDEKSEYIKSDFNQDFEDGGNLDERVS